ncbi:hypothetical protein Tco_1452528 [Tanacetum coccineum]
MIFQDKNCLDFFNTNEEKSKSSEPCDDWRDKTTEISKGTDNTLLRRIENSKSIKSKDNPNDSTSEESTSDVDDRAILEEKDSESNSEGDDSFYQEFNDVEAMNLEIEALNRNGTWVVTKLHVGRKPIGSKWVYKVKYKSTGEVKRFKASDLVDDVYMSLPDGYLDKFDTRFCNLVKSLYDLKQSPRK